MEQIISLDKLNGCRGKVVPNEIILGVAIWEVNEKCGLNLKPEDIRKTGVIDVDSMIIDGGKVVPNILEVATREVKEKCGLNLKPEDIKKIGVISVESMIIQGLYKVFKTRGAISFGVEQWKF